MIESDSTPQKKNQAVPIGELLVREGFISDSDLKNALIIQENEKQESSLPFETLLIKKNFLTRTQLDILKGHPDPGFPEGGSRP